MRFSILWWRRNHIVIIKTSKISMVIAGDNNGKIFKRNCNPFSKPFLFTQFFLKAIEPAITHTLLPSLFLNQVFRMFVFKKIMFLKYFPYRSVVYFLQKCFYMHVDKQVYAISKKRFLKGSPIFIKIFTFFFMQFFSYIHIFHLIQRENINIYSKNNGKISHFYYSCICIREFSEPLIVKLIIRINDFIPGSLQFLFKRKKLIIVTPWHQDINIIIPRYHSFMTNRP